MRFLELYRMLRTRTLRKLYAGTALLLTIILLDLYYQSETGNTSLIPVPWRSYKRPIVLGEIETDDRVRHKKWIVVASIYHPTEQIRQLSQIPGWKLLVVADVKTPLNWTFRNVTLLNTTYQEKLGFNVLKFLPWNSYTRKVIGYLYAIQHEAQFIYDTDDDNAPNDPLTFENNFVLEKISRGLMTESRNLVENPYAHFGQRTVWPRGFPLDQISQPRSKTYTACPMHTPIIQQGLVNGDPDVDAIFRLTRRFLSPNIQFDGHAPPMILPRFVLAPYNSQNTLFHYEAFWSLIFPVSVTFRVTDIWRGYWAQPLLWAIGGHLGFYPPQATQVRNAHVYLRDFGEEDQLYKQSGALTRFLANWQCSQTTLYNCMLELTEAMGNNNNSYWSPLETDLMRAWISDLKAIGYKEPAFMTRPPCLKHETKSLVTFSGVDSTGTDLQRNTLRGYCGLKSRTSRPAPTYPKQLLIVTFAFPHYENIWLLDQVYRPHFPNILYCGEASLLLLNKIMASKGFIAAGLKDISFVGTQNSENGSLLYECVLRAIEMKYTVSGYVVVADDVLFNFWNHWRFNPKEMWIQSLRYYGNIHDRLDTKPNSVGNWLNLTAQHAPALKAISALYNSTNPLVQEFVKQREGHGINSSLLSYAPSSDLFYVPAIRQEMYYAVGKILLEAKVFLEIATLLLSEGISGPKTVYLSGTSLWTLREQNEPFKSFRTSNSFLRPVKPSQVKSDPLFRHQYCQLYIGRVLRHQLKETFTFTIPTSTTELSLSLDSEKQ